MAHVHRIRLQAAWEGCPRGTTWTRSFGRPSGVGPGDRVWLVVERPAACTVALNGRDLPAVIPGAAVWRHHVTADLLERNEVRLAAGSAVAVPAAGRQPLPESLGIVTLEIESEG
jgi:hypothetical protein